MTINEFRVIWRRMLQAWPGSKIESGTPEAYARSLAAFEPGEVLVVIEALQAESEWLPSIAAIWQRCLAARDRAPGWEEAFDEATAHASDAAIPTAGGPPAAAPWSHEAVQEAARIIGPWSLRTDPVPTLRAQFRDAYLAVLGRQRREYASGARALPPPAPSAARLEAGPARRAITRAGVSDDRRPDSGAQPA
jgi:hypothetical protein